MTTTQTIDIAEILDIATEKGGRPFSAWVTVTENAWGGVDISNRESTYRITLDDETVTLHVFKGGRSMLLAGTQTFTGVFASEGFVAAALAGLL